MFEVLPNWHPILVHFSIALFVIAAALYLLTLIVGGRWASSVAAAARINLWLGAVFTIATVVAGIEAFATVEHAPSQLPFMNDHRNWALITAAIWWLIAISEGWRAWWLKSPSYLLLAVMVLAAAALGVAGWKGGELVYRHGIGVQRVASTAEFDRPASTRSLRSRRIVEIGRELAGR
jgi:uncharacterized membrane protein